jgi:hypothetical protein
MVLPLVIIIIIIIIIKLRDAGKKVQVTITIAHLHATPSSTTAIMTDLVVKNEVVMGVVGLLVTTAVAT